MRQLPYARTRTFSLVVMVALASLALTPFGNASPASRPEQMGR